MKLIHLSVLLAALLILSACDTFSVYNTSVNNAPQVKRVFTAVETLSSDFGADNNSGLMLHLVILVEDADGFDDLNMFFVRFPNGYTDRVEITDENIMFKDGTQSLVKSYHMDNEGPEGIRQFSMTGYTLQVIDHGGARDTVNFSISAPTDQFVPDGARLVHPDDFDNINNNTTYVKALAKPELLAAEYNANTRNITATLVNHDVRAVELELGLGFGETFFGSVQDKDVTEMADIGVAFTYTFSLGDIIKDDDAEPFEMADINRIGVMVYDAGEKTNDIFNTLSHAFSQSEIITF